MAVADSNQKLLHFGFYAYALSIMGTSMASERQISPGGTVVKQRTKREGTFQLVSEFSPAGDQPSAIHQLTDGLSSGVKHQCLLGVTGSGKTFTMANVIQDLNRPALVLAPNKTLAAQLYGEFKDLFPHNAVEYFVSYYDYYQPEAFVPSTNTYIAKDARINEEIDRLRHSATRALLERTDVIIVASVSCIYGIGSVEAYFDMLVPLITGEETDRDEVISDFVRLHYSRDDGDFHRGTFRVRGDVVDIWPSHSEGQSIRIEWFGDDIERISLIDPLRGSTLSILDRYTVYPNSHYVAPPEYMAKAITSIEEELVGWLPKLRNQGKMEEAQRLEERTRYDLELLTQFGQCKGIENYSRHLTQRAPGEPPPTLLDYFPEDFIFIVDESHVALPQVGGMFRGDQSRKSTLVDHGFRLPSAMDNRPLRFDEFEERVHQVVYVSATPKEYEIEASEGVVVEMIVRPTGLLDPVVEVRPVGTQVDDLLAEIRETVKRNERILVTTLTKRMAEDLTEYYREVGVRVRYLHSDVDTLDRVALLRDLRLGTFDVLVGINLLREGLDIPEVSLVAILDADKEGFLRAYRSMIQTFGRAARNASGRVILYGDRITDSMKRAMDETERRRVLQKAHNEEHGIVPTTILKPVNDLELGGGNPQVEGETEYERWVLDEGISDKEVAQRIEGLRKDMFAAAKEREYEAAAVLRDRIQGLEQARLLMGG